MGAGFRHLRQDLGRRFSVTAKVRAEHQLEQVNSEMEKGIHTACQVLRRLDERKLCRECVMYGRKLQASLAESRVAS